MGTRRLLAELPPVEGVAMKSVTIILLMLVLTAGCASRLQQGSRPDTAQTPYERQEATVGVAAAAAEVVVEGDTDTRGRAQVSWL